MQHRLPAGSGRAPSSADTPRAERGASLIFSLAAMAGLSVAAAAMLRTTDNSAMIAGNIGFHESAVQSSDLALEAAVTFLSTFAKTAASNSDATDSNYYASLDSSAPSAMEPPTSRLSTSTPNPIVDAATGNTIRYVIERMCASTGAASSVNCLMEDAASPTFRVTTLVVGPRNTSATVQHHVTAGGFSPNCAIMTNESFNANGTISITGAGNCVYSNTDANWTNGAGSAVGDVYAVGSVTGNVAGAGGTAHSFAAAITIPVISPSSYRQYADYIFKADGKIYNRAGALVTDTVVSGAWWGWDLASTSPVRWRKSNTTPSPEGLYFFEGNVTSNANVGNAGAPFRVSLFATGSIDLSGGSAVYEDYKGTDPTVPQGVKDVFLMAGGDINFRGGFSAAAVPGSILANEEVDMRGSSGFVGNLVARNSNATDPAGMDNVANSNNFSGTTTVVYDPLSIAPLWSTTPIRRQWRTVMR
ncbi:MAG: hypothetical protein ACM3PU_06110 [Gemmatimonadota bacterium]